jgi:integrase
MVYKQAGRRYYTVKFRFEGRLIQKRTKATNKKDAKDIAARIRSELAKGNYGILKPKPKPTLGEFLKKEFLPFVETEFKIKKNKPHTLSYYNYGAKSIMASDLAKLRLSEITSQHVNAYVAQRGRLALSTIHRDLRTLKRALSLAVEWGKLDRRPKITVKADDEHKRERTLTEQEAERYLSACPQPWRDVATIMLSTGMRPGEVYKLRWEHIALTGHGGLIQITEGKSKAAKRILPIIPKLYLALKARHDEEGQPERGWVFPAGSRSGHLEESSAKQYHAKALARLSEAHEDDPKANPELKPFAPYCLRHTALTWLNKAGCDAYDLAKIAGHSNIRITQRYIHPDTDSIEAAFQKLALCTDGSYQLKLTESAETEGDMVTD